MSSNESKRSRYPSELSRLLPRAEGARSLRSELPVSASELAPEGTAVPDSAGVPLAGRFGVNHSYRRDTPATTDDARLLSRLNTVGTVGSVVLPHTTAGAVRLPISRNQTMTAGVCPPYSRLLRRRSLRREAYSACNSVNWSQSRVEEYANLYAHWSFSKGSTTETSIMAVERRETALYWPNPKQDGWVLL